jgi:uncharacterized membrane protein YciS (DUF1049 family)
MKKWISILVFIAFLMFGVLLSVLNPAKIQLDLLWTSLEIPLAVILAVSLASGMFIAWVICQFNRLIRA